MVTKRLRSEYMKKFKDPKWETYAKCYEDLVVYRLSRRTLEHTHNPWFWDESVSETESSDRCTPQETTKDYGLQKDEKVSTAKETAVHKEPGAEETREPETSQIREQVTEDIKPQEKEEAKGTALSTVAARVIPPAKYPCIQSNTKSKPAGQHKATGTKAKHQIIKGIDKESRHPFAMYGSGEKQADMASKRTHNVGPSATTKEIHESALRAKARREIEKQIKRMDKRRAKSADLEKFNKSKLVPDYNPWMTEYMRCFSARSQ